MIEKEMDDEMENESESPKSEKDWEAECAAQDLMRAQMVKEKPELYKKALAHLQKQKKAIESIDDLKALKNKKFTES